MAGRVMGCDFSCWRDWGPESLRATARGLLQPTPAATRTEAKTNPKILFMAILVQLFFGVIPDSIAGTGMPAFFGSGAGRVRSDGCRPGRWGLVGGPSC